MQAAPPAAAQQQRLQRVVSLGEMGPPGRMGKPPLLGGTIGLIGLGNIGMCVCKRLLCAGFHVRACEIREQTVAQLQKMGAEVVANPAETARGVALVIVCVFTSAQAKDVLFGNLDSGEDGLIAGLPRGGTVCLHTTVSPDQASKFAMRLEKSGHYFVDAPIIGGKTGADTGTLTIVASGADEAIEAVTNPLRQVGERFFRCGDRAGAASSVKMIDTMLIGVHTVAAAEAIAFAAKSGASPKLVHEALQHGMGNSRVFEKWVPAMMPDETAGPADCNTHGMASMKKDLSITLEAAKEFSFPMPMTALALQQVMCDDMTDAPCCQRPAAVRVCERARARVSAVCGRVWKGERGVGH
jgi:putative dehydrogenase